jgi:aminobenzoyl-glutamate utilization protein B
MKQIFRKLPTLLLVVGTFLTQPIVAQKLSPQKLKALQKEIIEEVDKKKEFSAQVNDMIFSFAELGFQETETSQYLINLLEKEGFTIQKGISGVPTAWIATWGSGKPVIAIGSDVDCIPKPLKNLV